MPLPGFVSECERRAGIIVSKDRREKRRHVAHNVDKNIVAQYRVDGAVYKDGKKCDYLLINEEKRVAYLIELKGRHLSEAAAQLLETEAALKSWLTPYTMQYRIIASKCRTQEIRGLMFNKFRIQKGSALKFCTDVMTEKI